MEFIRETDGLQAAQMFLCMDGQIDRHPFNGLFSRTTRVSRHQKDQTDRDFNEARDDGMEVSSAGPYVNHLHRQIIITQFFNRPDALPDAEPIVSKH